MRFSNGSVCLLGCSLFGEKCVQLVESRDVSLGRAPLRNTT
jgi:hypothetical protein